MTFAYAPSHITGDASPHGLFSLATDRTIPESWGLRFDPARWRPENVLQAFPELPVLHAQNRFFRATSYRFKNWYDYEASCLLYGLGDIGLYSQRLTGTSNLGALSGDYDIKDMLTEKFVLRLIERSGLTLTGDDIVIDEDAHAVAIYVRENRDYHIVRIDRMNISGSADFVCSHKARGSAPRMVTSYDGSLVGDPRRIFFMPGYGFRASPNPSRTRQEDVYNFVSYVIVPHTLSVSRDTVEIHRRRIKRDDPELADNWDAHLDRLNLPKSGPILIPQYG